MVASFLGDALGRWLEFPLVHGQEGGANVTIEWRTLNLAAVPRTFYVRPGAPMKTWDTRSVASLQDAPVGEELRGALYVTSMKERQFVLVVENTGDTPLRFFAAPHEMAPPERSLGVVVKCLCVHTIFTVPPRQVWYRVMEAAAIPAETHGEVTVSHILVGLPTKPR